jgi:CheY-like chemotaxis protein
MALILVIDDAPKMRQTICRILVRAGHSVVEAEDGEVGLRCVDENQPTLVITDIIMPNKEGIETIRDIRRRRPDIKIIAISGSGAPRQALYLDAATALGADAALGKPFRAHELLALVDRLIAGA